MAFFDVDKRTKMVCMVPITRHLTAGAPPMIRVAGAIKSVSEDAAVLSPEDTRRLVVETLKEGQRTKLENEWQLDFALQVGDLGRFRGNACYVSGAIEANFRRIPSEIGDLKSLGHSPVVDKWCDEERGMILVTGASGEGKSTTLASMAQTIANRRSVNIVSIEDPIEFVHSQGRSLVNQREVGADARDFASALKNALRQDADVILVGELRDTETIQTALTAAETGPRSEAPCCAASTRKSIKSCFSTFCHVERSETSLAS